MMYLIVALVNLWGVYTSKEWTIWTRLNLFFAVTNSLLFLAGGI